MSRQLVILGGGTAGWMAANLFVKRWNTDKVQVTLVESPQIGTIGVGEGSTPTLKRFFELIDVDDADWMPRCNATYKLGIRFEGWSPVSGIESYRHPFLSQVDTFTQPAFTANCLARRNGADVNTTPDDFFLNARLTTARKGPEASENFPFEVDYGYHFDSNLLGNYLRELAVSRGAEHRQLRIDSVEQADDGTIAALIGEEGERITGDFFVDCSGFASVLMEKTLQVRYQSFDDNLFNDAAVVAQTPINVDSMLPETVSTALSCGWCWKIPLTNRYGNGYVYSSAFLSAEEAEQEFREYLGIMEDVETRHLRMRVGQLEEHWAGNCLAIGLAQGFIEPLEATALLLVQVSVEEFMRLWEKGQFSERHRDEFNRRSTDRFERVRDYIVAHYKLNTRDDSDYWRANREHMNLSAPLRYILDAWYRKRDVAAEIRERNIISHFGAPSWHCMFAGYGVFPPLGESRPMNGEDAYVRRGVEEFLDRCALNFDTLATN